MEIQDTRRFISIMDAMNVKIFNSIPKMYIKNLFGKFFWWLFYFLIVGRLIIIEDIK